MYAHSRNSDSLWALTVSITGHTDIFDNSYLLVLNTEIEELTGSYCTQTGWCGGQDRMVTITQT